MTTRTYFVRTFGCQMNAHDSERLSGMLESAGYLPAESEDADVVVYNTCAVRENADNKLYGNLGMLVRQREKRPGMQIAVGGCLAQKDRHEILRRAPWVDVVFGTHNFGSLPVLLERARINNEAQIEILEALEVFPSSLPTKRDSTLSLTEYRKVPYSYCRSESFKILSRTLFGIESLSAPLEDIS